MTWARRVAILLVWTGMCVVLFGGLMFVFTFGDCRGEDLACRERQLASGQMVTIGASILYGIGIGVMLQRWLLAGRRR